MSQIHTFNNPFKRILFCTDFSENADFAFRFALDAAQREPDSRLHLLHVVPESEAQFWKSYMYEVDNVDEKARQDIDEHINTSYRSLVPEGLSFQTEFRIGKDSQEILDYAKTHQIDLIVMGRQGQSGLQTALFGNVTEKVCRHAECAVMVIPLAYQKRLVRKTC
jgi:nucleotide-binding universal stress UspA family protein